MRNIFESLKYNCWQKLLDRGVVANSQKYDHSYKVSGKGLEVSFDLLVALSSADYPFLVGETIVLLGYRTALIPIEIHENFVQYHLETSDSVQINPHHLNLEEAAHVIDIAILRERRCFLGWCNEAQIRLGTRDLIETTQLRSSKAEKIEHSLKMQGLALTLQPATIAPFQAGAA
jgi:hypothetical protein